MNIEQTKKTLVERFQHLLNLISSERLLRKQGLNNEVPFFICPYKPEEAVEMERMTTQLLNRLEQSGVRVLKINLYDLAVELLKKEGDWEFGRKRSQRFSTAIDQAYGRVTKQNVTDVIEKYKANYKVSIEDFAEKVQTYIDCQGSNFRLNFFVDEVGQYIADNVKLMTNLQTIAESLATKCRGRAWIVVTAQEDMNTVVGEMGKQQGNDFSKIQDRFATRMKLTGADVAEVIQKRLLTKNESAVEQLADVYHAKFNNFKTLFDFADGSQTYRNFNDRDHFIHCYPFIPY